MVKFLGSPNYVWSPLFVSLLSSCKDSAEPQAFMFHVQPNNYIFLFMMGFVWMLICLIAKNKLHCPSMINSLLKQKYKFD